MLRYVSNETAAFSCWGKVITNSLYHEMASKNLSFFQNLRLNALQKWKAAMMSIQGWSCPVVSGEFYSLLPSEFRLPYSKIKLLLKGYSSYVSYAELSLCYAELDIMNEAKLGSGGLCTFECFCAFLGKVYCNPQPGFLAPLEQFLWTNVVSHTRSWL